MYEPSGDPKHPLSPVGGVGRFLPRVLLRGQVDSEPTALRAIVLRIFGPLVAIAIVAACAVGYLALAAARQGNAPAAQVRAFCADEISQEYLTAYGLTTPDATGLAPDQFVRWSQQRDQRYGVARSCAITGRDYIRLFGPTQAAFTVAVVFAGGKTATGDVNVYNVAPPQSKWDFNPQPARWAITNFDAPLHLSP